MKNYAASQQQCNVIGFSAFDMLQLTSLYLNYLKRLFEMLNFVILISIRDCYFLLDIILCFKICNLLDLGYI